MWKSITDVSKMHLRFKHFYWGVSPHSPLQYPLGSSGFFVFFPHFLMLASLALRGSRRPPSVQTHGASTCPALVANDDQPLQMCLGVAPPDAGCGDAACSRGLLQAATARPLGRFGDQTTVRQKIKTGLTSSSESRESKTRGEGINRPRQPDKSVLTRPDKQQLQLHKC